MSDGLGVVFDKHVQVKTLILFVMSCLTHPIASDMLTELALCDERLNYFDVTECISKLVKSKHLSETDGKLALTAKGVRNSENLQDVLPRSVRVKAEDAAAKINVALSRDSLLETSSRAGDSGGWLTRLSLSDGISPILTIELMAANEGQAAALENGFREKSDSIYRSILDLLAN